MKPISLSRALAALAHPLAVCAAALLLLNALVWQRLWPSWWTGKLGDFAWLVIVPLLAAVPLSGALGWSALPLRRLSSRAFIALDIWLVALAFALVKAVPAVNGLALRLGASLGLDLKLRLDPTDLLALPAVLLAAWIFEHPPRQPRRALQAGALVLAALAVMADVAAPTDFGIDCLTRDNAGFIALREIKHPSELPGGDDLVKTLYRSSDGLTWALNAKADASKITCAAFPQWPVQDPSDPGVQLYFVPDQGLYRSNDHGLNLELEQRLKKAADYTTDSATGNLIVAAGTDGIWVKTTAGKWVHALNLKTP